MNRKNMLLSFIFSIALLFNAAARQEDTAYTKVITQRAEKITKTLGLKTKKEKKATEVVTNQYRQLNNIHEGFKKTVAALKLQYTTDKTALATATKAEEKKRDSLLALQHTSFLQQLKKVMKPAQVEAVKDGMTYNLVNVTYGAYVDMIPRLKDEEKKQLYAWLVEARELAMDAGSSDGKHAIFGKYKGRINNYLSQQGYDAQKERVDWEARIKARTEASKNN